ncbi:orotidine-5'-phosphate decarboxylase [Haematospirillum sp. 15-248]|uniref:orotidine-5'-phosphate decarboxylase n=1 Tax=Haematospirillum sp. 15-248 TaxID=2723107 RepID=UPI002AC36306|nr:orotidine-5'-phosphate decarboxylase [Haematospirillum sp. 15-248]
MYSVLAESGGGAITIGILALDRIPAMFPANPLFVALDTVDHTRAVRLASAVKDLAGGIKLGLEYYSAHGPDGVRSVQEVSGGLSLFLDLKFHDIPNTVAGAVRAACQLSPFCMTLHAGGGRDMMRAAADAVHEEAGRCGIVRPRLFAVTVLTSLNAADLAEVGLPRVPTDQVRHLVSLARDCRMDGVVCSAYEAELVRSACGPDFAIVVPGIRPLWAGSGDQKRVATPAEAREAGADYLVVGRPVTTAEDPSQAVYRILEELADPAFSQQGDYV